MKTTVMAPSNIAFIKYWGKKDDRLRLPTNGSVSVNLSNLSTTTTVEFVRHLRTDQIEVNGVAVDDMNSRIGKHLDRIRQLSKTDLRAKVVSKNNFPTASGLASSASGFAALTLAAVKSIGLDLSERQISSLARQGSGSACRSIPDGFVEWREGNDDSSSYAESIFPAGHWDLSIVVCLFSDSPKKTLTTAGQNLAFTSPFFLTRLKKINDKIFTIKKLIEKRSFDEFGQLIEHEALELHAIMLTSTPPLIYWSPETVKLMKLIQELREDKGVPVYFTIDAGAHMHLICETGSLKKVISFLGRQDFIKQTIINKPFSGARVINQHLF